MDKKIEIKTSTNNNRKIGLIKGTTGTNKNNKQRRLIPLEANYYFFTLLMDENIKNKNAKIALFGLINRKKIIKSSLHPSKMKKSNHLNYEVPYSLLINVKQIYNFYIKK